MSSNNKSVLGLPELLAGLANLRGQEKYADFVIECHGIKFPVHKVVLCSQSEYFDKACGGGFLVSGSLIFLYMEGA